MTLTALLALMGSSLIYAELLNNSSPDAAFYLLPTRIWELTAGAILSLLATDSQHRRPLGRIAPFLATIGLIVLFLAFYIFNESTPHPGIRTLVPVLATCLIIMFASGNGIATRILSMKWLVGIGLMSYSLYLFHNPALAFARILKNSELSQLEAISVVVMSSLASYLSWRFVENFFRSPSKIATRQFSLTVGTVGLVLMSVVIGSSLTNGFQNRLPEMVIAAANSSEEFKRLEQNGSSCHRSNFSSPCQFALGSEGSDWLLVGDSHAGVLAPTMYEYLSSRPGVRSFTTSVWGGCPLVVDAKQEQPEAISCEKANQFKMHYLRTLKPSVVVVSQRMGLWLTGERFDNKVGGVEGGTVNRLIPVQRTLSENLTRTVKQILDMGHRVVLVYPIPEVGWDVPKQVLFDTKGMSLNEIGKWATTKGVRTPLKVYLDRNKGVFEAYDRVPDSKNLLRIHPHELFCDRVLGECMTHDGSSIYYSDDDHLSRSGAQIVVGHILKQAKERWGSELFQDKLL